MKTITNSLSLSAVVLVAILFIMPSASSANQSLTTGNSVVEATVANGTGLITIMLTGGDMLSSPEHSYLNVRIDSDIWTNNEYAAAATGSKAKLLSLPGSSVLIGDTIVTVWMGIDGVDLLQRVYPVMIGSIGQIVVDYSFANYSPTAATVAVQYALDIDVAGNDAASMQTTTTPMSNNWVEFPGVKGAVPAYFLGAQFSPLSKQQSPGIFAESIISDKLLGSSIGLIPPDTFIIGDWSILTAVPWIAGIRMPGVYNDAAVVYTWNVSTISSSSSKDIVRFAYGTGIDTSLAASVPMDVRSNSNFEASFDPVFSATKLSYTPCSEPREVEIFDLLGARVMTTAVQPMTASLVIPSTLLRSGVYFAKLAGSKARFVIAH